MQTTSATLDSPIPVPQIDSDEPVAVIPVASVAPPDGAPDGERITMFALAPKPTGAGFGSPGAGLGLRDRVLRQPLAAVAAAFALGLVVARVLL